MSFFPIRCFTCGKPISQYWEKFVSERNSISDDEEDKTTAIKRILNKYGIGRICCMRMFMTHVDIEHFQQLYPVHKDNVERLDSSTKRKKPQNYTFKNESVEEEEGGLEGDDEE